MVQSQALAQTHQFKMYLIDFKKNIFYEYILWLL
jgi:hypothetical protein